MASRATGSTANRSSLNSAHAASAMPAAVPMAPYSSSDTSSPARPPAYNSHAGTGVNRTAANWRRLTRREDSANRPSTNTPASVISTESRRNPDRSAIRGETTLLNGGPLTSYEANTR